MAPRFQNIKPGDQIEMPAKRALLYPERDNRDPERPARIAVVTHRWFDPVDRKEYIGIAPLRRDGTYGDPKAKHTIQGLAQQGWRPATTDWIQRCKAMEAGEVVPLRPRP